MCHFDMKEEETTFDARMGFCIKKGIKVYPVINSGISDIIIEFNGKKKNVGRQIRTNDEMMDEVINQYNIYYKFLKGLEKCK
jgi:hypothetical protein